jgi:3-oxoadipate enol-lactonase
MGFVSVNDMSFYVERSGTMNAQSLVFINSLGTDYRLWNQIMPSFTEFDCIRYDFRGHGLSDGSPAPYSIADHRNDLKSLLDRLTIKEQIVLVGISIGGLIAMDFTASYPETVKALILLDTSTKIGTETMWNERIATLRQHGIAHLGHTLLSRWFAPSFREKQPSAYAAYYNMLTRMPVEGYIGSCAALRDADLHEAAKTIACPTLLLCGAEDLATPPNLVRALTESIKDSRYVEIAGAAHLPCVENPEATAAAMNSFLKDVL